jgi:hypothetical protein
MTTQDWHDMNKFLMDLHFIQANAIVGAELQGNKQAIKYMKRIAELRELVKLEAGTKEQHMTCKHRWEEGTNKEHPAYRCVRCGEWRLIK